MEKYNKISSKMYKQLVQQNVQQKVQQKSSVSEPSKVQQFLFQTLRTLLFAGVQKL